jgi:integral membrane protein
MRLLHAYFSFRPFSDREAWTLFKVAALLEAIGWSLLIFGIIFRDHIMPSNGALVAVGGRVHGIFFALYIAAVLAFAPSLRWGPLKALIGLACSVPPYGSLLFEMWTAHSRQRQSARHFYRRALYNLATTN